MDNLIPTRIAVLIASHNRKPKTLAAIAAVQSQDLAAHFACTVFLLDDDGTDGTADAVRKAFPAVRLMHGDGFCFWNGGMRIVYASALKEDFHFYLFLNDDVDLSADAIQRLLDTSAVLAGKGESKAIVVGSLRDPHTGETSYGGVVRVSRFRPLTFARISPGNKAIRCDTFNGNIVLIPGAVARLVGNLSPAFQHAMGDIDYGLRAGRLGCSVWVAPGYFGACSRNSPGKAEDRTLPFRDRWKAFCGLKGLPPKQWRVVASRHAGPLWPLYFISPYVQFALKCLLQRPLALHQESSTPTHQYPRRDQV